MIVTNIKRYNNFIICYGSLRGGDVIYHSNNDMTGFHTFFYGIRGDGYLYCPEKNEKIHPATMDRYIENISRFYNMPLEYHAISENNLDYLMLIKRKDVSIVELKDLWLPTGEQKIIKIKKDQTIICFEGEAQIVHNNGSNTIKDLNSVTSSKDQNINVKSLNNAKLVIVTCERE